MKIIISIAISVIAFAGIAEAQIKSVYTSTKTSACRTISSNPNEAGSYEGECKGVGGYKIRLLEGDIRQTINIITPGKKKFELNFWGFYGGFSSVGEKIEWRTKGGVPIALIARFIVADFEDSNKNPGEFGHSGCAALWHGAVQGHEAARAPRRLHRTDRSPVPDAPRQGF